MTTTARSCPDLTASGLAPEFLEDAVWDEREAHLEPASITAVAEAARADGRSWEAIGAVGITRQSAHTRWAKHETAGGR